MKKGWQTKTLGEICTVDWGNTDLTKSAYVEGGEFLAVSAAGCDGRIGHKEHEKYTPVLSAIGAQCGRMFLPEEDFTAIKNTITLTPRDGTCTGRFLYQLLTHVELPKRGAAQPFISKGDIQSFQVPVPPLAEQQRIVGLLDEAFEGLATAKANAEKNLQNARALFESHLQSVFTQRGPGWVKKRIEEWCDSIMDCVNKTAPVVEDPTPFKMIRTTNVRHGCVDVSSVRYVTEETYQVWTRRQTPQKGDVILTREAPMGEAGMLLTDDKVFLGQRLVSYRANSAQLDNHFLLFALQSSNLQGQIHAKASGSTVQHMRVPDTKNLLLAAPSLAKQREVVTQLASLHEETQRLTRLYERKLAALEALKKSLLHQAFAGEL